MRLRTSLAVLLLLTGLAAVACRDEAINPAGPKPTQPGAKVNAGPLPSDGYKAEITITSPPATMRPGQKETIRVKVKNASNVQWYSHGGEINTNPDNRFYLAAANRWMKPDGKTLVTNMDGRYGLGKDLKPGEVDDVPLQITAPKVPGEYLLEVDLVQEAVAWFSDKGSTTAKAKVTVVNK